MDQLKHTVYALKFEIAFIKKGGNEFQDFFSDIMERCHPGDFLRTRPWGNIGDRKNDGYLRSSRMLFQVYAPNDMDAANAIAKIHTDFHGALPYWQKYFDKWTFVHNSRQGLGPDITAKLLELDDNYPYIKIGWWGFEELRVRVLSLNEIDLASLLGAAPSNKDMYDVRYDNILEVLNHIAKQEAPLDQDLRPVPFDKLSFNRLSESVRILLTAGMQRARLVQNLFAEHPDPLYGDEVAAAFKKEYNKYRNLEMAPDLIFLKLQEFTGGLERGTPTDQAAVLAVLAYLFEQCEIFERPPVEVAL
jgi:hypothetical protein